MSAISSMFGNAPGIGTPIEEFENVCMFGIQAQMKWWGAYFASTAADPTNTGSTFRLRSGLVMGVIAASQQWTNYNPAATDGSQVARGINMYGLRMQDVWTGSNTNKFFAMCIGGNVKAANLFGLDAMARNQLRGAFTFDDEVQAGGLGGFPFALSVTKVADYTVLASDNGTEFTTLGAVGAVNFTLPTIAAGLGFTFTSLADQNMTVTSAEGNNIVALNDLSASSVAFSTGGQKIGGSVQVFSTDGVKWQVRLVSAGVAALTVV